MAHFLREELWRKPPMPGIIAVTGNGYVTKDGRLVMGRGAALQACERIPGIDREAGAIVSKYSSVDWNHIYHWIVVREQFLAQVGFAIFQVKYSWRDEASLGLIEESTTALLEYTRKNPELNIRMNFPGIGNGRRADAFEEIKRILSVLPNTVTICYR